MNNVNGAAEEAAHISSVNEGWACTGETGQNALLKTDMGVGGALHTPEPT